MHAPGDDAAVQAEKVEEPAPVKPKLTRVTPPEKQDPAVRYREASKQREKKAEWGSGDDGYKSPTSPSDKMRKNLPYKVKFFYPPLFQTRRTLTFRNVCSTNSVATGVISDLGN